jgi:hypothetical protein
MTKSNSNPALCRFTAYVPVQADTRFRVAAAAHRFAIRDAAQRAIELFIAQYPPDTAPALATARKD